MKRYIKSLESNGVDTWIDTITTRITAVYELVDCIECATDDSEGLPSAVIISDYDSFILSALDIFDDHNFDIIQEQESPYSQSYYAAFVKREDAAASDYKYILFVRLSDHHINNASKSGRQKYYRDLAQQLKQPASKSKQLWKLKEVIVDGIQYASYDDALAALDASLRQYD